MDEAISSFSFSDTYDVVLATMDQCSIVAILLGVGMN